jgi:hypothetical protein
MRELFESTFDGAAWHGPSMMEVLRSLTPHQAFQSSNHIHRVSELVQHMIAWRVFAIKKMQGDAFYEISQSDNWGESKNQNEETWQSLLSDLKQTQQDLLEQIDHFSGDKLNDQIPGKSYSFYTLLHGVIHHDLYHLGEIALLSRELMD